MFDALTKYKFYIKLYQWARKKCHETHMDIYKYDSKCANCGQWNSIINLDYENFVLETSFGYMQRCGCCKKTTFWNCNASMLPVHCDANGTPVQDK